MGVKLLQDELIEFYQQHKDSISPSTAQEDQQKFYKGWIGTIQNKVNPVLNRLNNKEKLDFLKTERLPKQFKGTVFGEAYTKLEFLIDKMVSFDYTRYTYDECMKFYASCDKYADDVLSWLKEKETPITEEK